MLYRGMRREGGRKRRVLIFCRCDSVVSTRSILDRAAMPCRGSILAALNQLRNGATRWVIPIVAAFACIICNAVSGARKGDTIIRWTRKRGGRYTQGM